MKQIKNKKVFITGCTRGIGKSISKKFYKEGYKVYGIGTKKLKKNPTFINQYYNFDFLVEEDIKNCSRLISEIKPNILINNAGINIKNFVEHISYKEFNDTLRVNLIAPFELCKSAIPYMKRNRWGRIINITSIWSKTSLSKRASYSSSKFGLHGLTVAMSKELAKFSILINSVSPGIVDTELTKKNLKGQERKKLLELVPIKRLAKTDEVSSLIFWLTSNENTYLTGENISIDGGFQ